MARKQNAKVNSNLVIAVLAIIMVIAIVAIIAINAGKHGKNITAQLNEEFTLNKYGSATIHNGEDIIVFSIQSDLNYIEGEDLKIPYIINVNGVDYNGVYTFADSYAIHSEPNGMIYKADFELIENGAVTVMMYKDESTTEK